MENLRFTIEDREIAELLGRQNFSTKESAIFELLKNSYDAGAKNCEIYISEDCIKIIDNGKGMNEEEIKRDWMHVGKSNKGYLDEINNRVLTGAKGVGRFAIARLGNSATVISKKENRVAVFWETDWVTSNFKETSVTFNRGTHIIITNIRDRWRSRDVTNLIEFLNRAYKNKEMEVSVHFNDEEPYIVQSIFNDIKTGVNYSTRILLEYNSENMDLTVTVESDEFNEKISEVIDYTNATFYREGFNMESELKFVKNIEEAEYYLKKLGDFRAEFYFRLDKQPKDIAEKFMYKYNGLEELKIGIALYRNDFSISSLDGNRDWLEIASRARKSPAAATHSTGSWRVRLNQIFGFVSIDKKKNANLKDLANRQGLEEDEYYQLFVEILQFGIGRFEKYRQTIIRKIDAKNKFDSSQRKKEGKKLPAFLKKPSSVTTMTEKEIDSLATEIKDIQKEVKEKTKVFKENEQKHKYDVRILNVLATQGLRASAIAHELQNKRNALSTGFQDIISALKEYGYWDELNSEEYTQVSYKNVPKTLENLEEINIKLIAFLDVILNKIEKHKFNSKIKSIETTLTKITSAWEKHYNWIDFQIEINSEKQEEYQISEDVLDVIFDNLILNSIQHNEMIDRLIIRIEVKISGDLINLKYSDNGIGLDKKYKIDPIRILEVHETSRSDGHGLGMWIVNNTLHMYEGKFIEIIGEQGFSVEFKLRG